jgi:hypothetical protein
MYLRFGPFSRIPAGARGSFAVLWVVVFVTASLGFGIGSASESGTTRIGQDSWVSRAEGSWYVVSRSTDNCGKRDVMRRGKYSAVTDSGWGYRKVALKHNIKRQKIWRRVIQVSCGDRRGTSTTWLYEAWVTKYACGSTGCVPEKRIKVRAVEQRKLSRGHRKGNITMYCVGRVRCPDWINTTPILGRTVPQTVEGLRVESIG